MITKEQWITIKKELQGFRPIVKFSLGEDKVDIERVIFSENKTGLAVFINGSIKGSWFSPDSAEYNPLVEILWRKRVMHRYSPSQKKKLTKGISKRQIKEWFPDLDKKTLYYDMKFNTAGTLVTQYKKIQNLKLVQCGLDKETTSE